MAKLKHRRAPAIEFLCRPADEGVIAPPVPAGAALPGWFRRLPGVDPDHLQVTNNGVTVKRCLPFLDALAVGWLLPLAAEVRLEITDDGATVNAGWEFDREMVSNHSAFQVEGNPFAPRPPMKFHNHWTIRTPPGWSCLFLPPVNRPNNIVQVLSGMVDTDSYTAPVNLPFFAIGPDGVHTLPKGMPLAQVIPFRRDDLHLEAEIRAESDDDARVREHVHRNTLAGTSWYRREARGRRPASRQV